MKRPAADQWHFWIDRGGTFTDIVAWCEGVSDLMTAKVRSEDPNRAEDASVAAIRMVLDLDEQVDLRTLGSMSIRMGTTVATNALLTRSGARTAVVLTAGLGDLLVLRDQSRPRLFELDIKRPRPVWEQIIQADERLDVAGGLLRPLDEKKLLEDLLKARKSGCEACAIALVHGWQHPIHEMRAMELAREAGFMEVRASHQVCPLQGLLGRAQTTVVEATLTPPLEAFHRSLDRGLA